MANAQGSRIQLGYQAETTFNTAPGAPDVKALRTTGTTLGLGKGILESGELRSDRQRVDVRHGIHDVTGDIDAELIYGDYDAFFEALLGGTWSGQAAGTPNTLVNGTTFRSFLIEVGHTDIGKYRQHLGCTIDKCSISVKPGSITTVKWGIKGASQATITSSPFDATMTAATTNSPMDSLANATINEGGSPIAIVSGIELNIDNQGSPTHVIGKNQATDIVQGRMKIDGTLSAYFANTTMLDKFLSETDSSLDFTLAGTPTNKTLKFELPRIKYTGGKIDVNTEGPLILSMPFQGLYHSVSTFAMRITRSNP